MKNLAGNKDSDKFIREELRLANVEEVIVPIYGEVESAIKGVLKVGNFNYEFDRAWCYWRVSGLVPLEVADKLYVHPEGKKNIRVAGHCGCPPPTSWVTYIDKNGKERVTTKQQAAFAPLKGLWEENKHRYVISDSTVGFSAYIDHYHIDSQAGLLFFVETLKRYLPKK